MNRRTRSEIPPHSDASIKLVPQNPDLQIAFILIPGFTLLAFSGFIDTLRHAADHADGSRQIFCKWTILGLDQKPVQASCGVSVAPWRNFSDPSEYDYIVVVGGLTRQVGEHLSEIYDYLKIADAQDVPLVGLCVGGFVLAEAGLMEQRKCAVHFRHLNEMVERYPNVIPVVDEVFVDDGNRVTSPGGTASIDVAVSILIKHYGKARALKGLSHMMVDRYREGSHIPRHPYDDVVNSGDWRVDQGVRLMKENMMFPFTTRVLAQKLGCSTRQLNRSFNKQTQSSPAGFWKQIRLQHAHWSLLHTKKTITQIAIECGFSDCSHFSKSFSLLYKKPPSVFRAERDKAAQSVP